MSNQKGKALVIGAGITGLCASYYLINKGWQVEILEQNNLTDNCSYGNAGMIVPSHFTPMTAPGVVSQGIKWMFNSRSPFYIRPTLSPKSWNWGIQFLKHANQKHVNTSIRAIRDLNLASSALYNELAITDEFNFDLNQNGILMLYKTEKVAEEEIELAHVAKELGLEVEILNSADLQVLEPNVRLDVLGGVNYKCDGHLNPMKLMSQLISYLLKNGVLFHKLHKVSGFEIVKNKVQHVIANGKKFSANKIVLTGGSFLPELAAKAGIKLHLMPGKGYSFLYQPSNPDLQLSHAALLLEAKVAVTPMGRQIRFGGTMELGRHLDRINMNRVEGIVNAIPQYLPNLQIPLPNASDIWQGYRPCAPDGLPYLGTASKLDNLIIAGGGGMMGLSLGPILGHTVAEIANKEKTSVDIGKFHPERFS